MQHTCFNEFPDQCSRCPEYTEKTNDQSMQLIWQIGTGIANPSPYLKKVVKECKLYHKRKVEYLR